ncbi:MAG: hypothetical protein L3J09_08085 [Flavobacteriaceae bacterium]|nr:hypothetical protein [Flavobacteriaceae bacterium]
MFTDNEKLIIERFKNYPSGRTFLANVIDRELSQARIQVYKAEKKAFILVEKNYYTTLDEVEKQRITQIYRWIMYVISVSFGLIEFLDECGTYINLRNVDITDDPVTIGPGLSDSNAHKFEITQTGVVEQLIKYIDVQIEIKPEIETLLN